MYNARISTVDHRRRNALLLSAAFVLLALVVAPWVLTDPNAPGPVTVPTTASVLGSPDLLGDGQPIEQPSALVLVANAGTGVSGAAGRVAAEVATGGFETLAAVNGTGPALGASLIHYQPGFRVAAEAVAAIVGVDNNAVALMPTDPPVSDLGGADVLVLLGLADALA